MDRKRQLLIVVGLLGLSCLVQVAVIRRAATTGLDAVRFVDVARSMDREGLLQTVRCHREQPLFPAWIWVVHEGLRRALGEFASSWAVSAQLAAAAALVLAVVPLYFLLRRLVGHPAAVAGSVFFCLLPEVSRLGADGISDSTHLLFFCLAFWAMVEYLERRKAEGGKRKGESGDRVGVFSLRACPPLWLLLAGAATAVAALARAEVLVLAAALGLTLAVFQLLPGRQERWGNLAAAAACFLVGLVVVWAPYLAATGALTHRTAPARILGGHQAARETPPSVGSTPGGGGYVRLPYPPTARYPAAVWRLPGGEPMSFDAKEPTISLRRRGYPAAVIRFGRKLADAAGYWIGALALWGAWRLRRAGVLGRESWTRIGWASAGDRFVQVFFLLFSVAIVRFSAAEGYLVPRHLMALVVAVVGAAGSGAVELGSRLPRVASGAWSLRLVFPRPKKTLAGQQPVAPSAPASQQPGALREPRADKCPRIAWAVVAVAGLACLPQTLVRLHHSRLGHRAAGQWLAGQTDLRGTVLDTQGWTGLYSGRPTYPYEEARAALSDPHLAYLVLEGREAEYPSGRSRTLRWLIEWAAEPLAEFPDPATRRPNQEPVVVCRWHADRFFSRIRAAAVGSIAAGGDGRPGAGTAPGCRTGFARVRNGICESLVGLRRGVSRTHSGGRSR
jgi:4-amino-4-deoxy-L-arabinose transferase-like glycosyltransferase